MCHKCTPMYLVERPQAAQDAISRLNLLSHAIDEASRSVTKLEDIYRDTGLLYHCTQLPARQSGNFPQAQLDQLKTYFEIFSATDYNILFQRLDTTICTLADLRSTYLRYSGTTQQLCQRAQELETAFALLSQQLEAFHVALDDHAEMVHALFDTSRALYETDEQGVRCAWQDASGPDPVRQPVPVRKGEEWSLFLAWVSALPEAGKAAGMGRKVEEVALDLLFGGEEGLEGDI